MPLIGFVSIWSALLLLKAGDFELFSSISVYFMPCVRCASSLRWWAMVTSWALHWVLLGGRLLTSSSLPGSGRSFLQNLFNLSNHPGILHVFFFDFFSMQLNDINAIKDKKWIHTVFLRCCCSRAFAARISSWHVSCCKALFALAWGWMC